MYLPTAFATELLVMTLKHIFKEITLVLGEYDSCLRKEHKVHSYPLKLYYYAIIKYT